MGDSCLLRRYGARELCDAEPDIHLYNRLLYMLASMLDTHRLALAEQPAVLEGLLSNQPLRQEMTELLVLLEDDVRRPTGPLDLPIPTPLQLHADYQLAEIMAGLAVVDAKSSKLIRPQAGVYWHERYRSRQLVRSVGSVTHQGERPMSITWRVHHPMPAELFEVMKVAAG